MSSKLPKALDAEQAATQIVRELRALADPRKAEAAQRYFKVPIQSLGLDATTLRGVAKTWTQRLKPSWHLDEACVLCDLLFQQPENDARAMGFLILGAFHREFDGGLWPLAEGWLKRHLDNWALVDGFASCVLSPLLKQDPKGDATLRRWIISECMWVRRAALVTLVPLARRGEHLDLTYELAEAALGEQEDLMHKAVGWMLREAGKTDPERLERFLLRHRGAIPRTSVRYAIERFPEAERKRLLQQTRGSATAHPQSKLRSK